MPRFPQTIRNLKLKIKNLKLSSGFTLIELLVVMSILAVLAGTIVVATNNARDKGKDARRKQDLQSISSALVAFYVDHHVYPPTDTSKPYIDQRAFASDAQDPTVSWLPEELTEYIPKLPKDPLQSSISNYFAKALGGLGKLATTFSQQRTIAKNGQVSGVVTGNLGNSTGFSNTDQYNSGNLQGNKFRMGSNNGTTNTTNAMYVYIGTSGGSSIDFTEPNNKFKLVIYNDNGGNPSTPVPNANGEGTITTASGGWRSVNFSSAVNLNANTDYWLFYTSNSGNQLLNNANWEPSSLTSGYFGFTYTDSFPSNPTPAPEVNRTYAIYVPFSYTTAIPTVTASSASGITTTTATVNGSANPNNDEATGYFRYSTTSPGANCNDSFGTRAPASSGTNLGSGSSSAPFSENITGLSPGTIYYFCAIGNNSLGTGFGSVQNFTTIAASGANTYTIQSSADDAKSVTETNHLSPTVTDNPVGHPFNPFPVGTGTCSETRHSYMRFSNIQILKNATINSATIKFTPRDLPADDPAPAASDKAANLTNPSSIKTIFKAEAADNAAPITGTNNTDWDNRTRTSAAANWNNIPKWAPSPSATDLTSPELNSIIQEIVNRGGWNSGNSINIFWQDNGTTAATEVVNLGGTDNRTTCPGRVPVSYDGQAAGLGNAPVLSIGWSTSGASSVSCTNGTTTPNVPTTLTGSGGSGSYSWSAPGASSATPSGANLTVKYGSTGIKTVTVTDASNSNLSATCTVTVNPGSAGSPPTCSNKITTVNTSVTLTVNGGTAPYTWFAPDASSATPNGPNLDVIYASEGEYLIRITDSGSQQGSCTVKVNATGTPGWNIGTGNYTDDQCNNRTKIYCLRLSSDKRVFVLWAQLENLNDPESYENANAKCQASDFAVGSIYEGLGQPTHTLPNPYNFCIKSPPL